MIYIYSLPINSGKTTNLINLTNDIKGCKKLCSLVSVKKIYKNKKEYFLYINMYKVGKVVEVSDNKLYYFQELFDEVYKFVVSYPFNFFIVDEAGYLELAKKGFYKIIKYLINNNKDCIICVRDCLLNDFISFYKLKKYLIFDNISEIKKCLR